MSTTTRHEAGTMGGSALMPAVRAAAVAVGSLVMAENYQAPAL